MQAAPPQLEAVASTSFEQGHGSSSEFRVALQRLELQKAVMERELQAQRTHNMETVKLYSARETLLRFELEQLRATNQRLVHKLNSPSDQTDSDTPHGSSSGSIKREILPAPTGIMPRNPRKRQRQGPETSPESCGTSPPRCGSLTPPGFQLPLTSNQNEAGFRGNMLTVKIEAGPTPPTVPKKKRRPYRRKDGKKTKRFEALTALKQLGGRGTVQDVASVLKYDCRTTADSLKGLRDKGLIVKVAEKLSSGSSLGGRPANIWQVVQGA